MTERYFRCLAGDALYESIRLALDAEWGHVPPTTCISTAALAPRDSSGRIILAVWDTFCDYPAVAVLLPELLASGAVEEIDAATYHAAAPPAP